MDIRSKITTDQVLAHLIMLKVVTRCEQKHGTLLIIRVDSGLDLEFVDIIARNGKSYYHYKSNYKTTSSRAL